ncbi:FAD-dependent oxidoreductase [Ovoidimarina sediminis]|uniref:FAD-dependent oxidoreductase n=1 Tax=Ovoidimarina sediminis TaxID=3079856 RepID=UPI00290FDDEC|nr:FAD-dependent oxidoreductase [Rhodophyticola sp. MJ-SS7]MDU8943139.1 FAD-dependent oxidoreductase [Rhodophyticola sp. MJ-SS7]
MSVTWHREGDAGIVTLDNPPVNAIGQPMRQGLMEALGWAAAEPGLTRVVVTGEGRAFAAGADAREFDGAPQPPHLPDVLDAIEASPVPWIAAINGVALGGGLEIALACAMRIAAPGVQLGLPEVTLGVIPGAGGTQRLPRLVGLGEAARMISGGRPVNAEKAFEIGLIDGVSDNSVAAALSAGLPANRPATSALPAPEPDPDALEEARRTAARKMAGQIAPPRALDLVEASATTPFREAMAAERDAFLTLREGPQARALCHLFFAERAAKPSPGIAATDPAPLDRIAIVGGGTMGAAIAYACLGAGLPVTLIETDDEAAARAEARIAKLIAGAEARGLRAPAIRAEITTDYAGAAPATLAIEAAFEAMEVKHSVFAALDGALSKDAILATNTSYLDIDEIAAQTRDPSRVLGLHFFAPAHIMKLLEIVRGAETSDTALATGYALAKRLRKVPVLAGVCDGFIGNRILARYREAADTLLMDGTNPWELDEAMVEFGYAMGPYEAQDMSGLDIAHANRRRQDATRDPARRYIPIGDRMVAEGRLGRKTGVGWYRYPGGGGKVVDPLVEDLVREEAHFAKVARVEYGADEIRRRLLLAMINEAADILEDGIAASAADIDLVTVLGYGFPRWRGGLMHYADTLGMRKILVQLQELAKEDPVVWTPSARIVRLAEEGGTFAGA